MPGRSRHGEASRGRAWQGDRNGRAATHPGSSPGRPRGARPCLVGRGTAWPGKAGLASGGRSHWRFDSSGTRARGWAWQGSALLGAAWLCWARQGVARGLAGGRSPLRFDSAAPTQDLAWLGGAWQGAARPGLGIQMGEWHTPGFESQAPALMAWQCWVRQGSVGRGAALQGRAGQGFWRASGTHPGSSPGRPRTGHGSAGPGMAWRFEAWRCKAGQGIGGRMVFAGVRLPGAHARRGLARRGGVWRGTAGRGLARPGRAGTTPTTRSDRFV